MTKKELEELVKRQSEQIAELTKMLAAMRMELQARKCNDITNDITDVMPKIYPQPYAVGTTTLPRWLEQVTWKTSLAN